MVVLPATQSADDAIALFRTLIDPREEFGRIEAVELGEWAALRVNIPDGDVHSAITPPYMEAFLELQKQLYQLAALAQTGLADVGQLSDADRRELQINVVVSGGSADYLAQIREPLEKLLIRMVGKMSGRQAAAVIIVVAALIAGGWAFSAWLEYKKTIGIEELKSKEHIEALQALRFSTESQEKVLTEILELLRQQGQLGEKAADVFGSTNEALLKAASKTRESVINGQTLTRSEAESLRVSPKKRSDTKLVIQPVRIVDINTSDPADLQIVLRDPNSGNEYRMRFADTLFASKDRDILFAALKTRELIWVELAVKEIDGEVRSVQLNRCVHRPSSLGEPDADPE